MRQVCLLLPFLATTRLHCHCLPDNCTQLLSNLPVLTLAHTAPHTAGRASLVKHESDPASALRPPASAFSVPSDDSI